MAQFDNSDSDYWWMHDFLQPTEIPQNDLTYFTLPDDMTSEHTSDTIYNTQSEEIHTPLSRKRSQTPQGSQEGTLTPPRKTQKLRASHETAKIREKGACYFCQRKRKVCQDGSDPKGPCRRCLERSHKIAFTPGLLRPLCWRPNTGDIEIFRRGPTIDFAASMRAKVEDAGPSKQALWRHFAIRRSGNEPCKTVELSQHWTSSTLKIRLDRYKPKETDKQYYPWFDGGNEQQYCVPPYGVAKLVAASSAIEQFLVQNFDGYIEAHMRNANEITRKTFQAAQGHKHFSLVKRALKLWVGCRFIEEPWSIVGSETLGMSLDVNPSCPYSERIPVPRIVDLQIDLIVINKTLQPEMKEILKKLKTMLESSDPWSNWLEIYLAYFILLHNVELTIAHDAWFVKRNNLKTKYSNKPLIDTVVQGANTLLTCFHYAHQGYAPFTNPKLEDTEQWTEDEKEYLRDTRQLVQRTRGDYVFDPARELFWTSQLHRSDWRPVVLTC